MESFELGIVAGTLGLGIGMLVYAAYRLLAWLFPA